MVIIINCVLLVFLICLVFLDCPFPNYDSGLSTLEFLSVQARRLRQVRRSQPKVGWAGHGLSYHHLWLVSTFPVQATDDETAAACTPCLRSLPHLLEDDVLNSGLMIPKRGLCGWWEAVGSTRCHIQGRAVPSVDAAGVQTPTTAWKRGAVEEKGLWKFSPSCHGG